MAKGAVCFLTIAIMADKQSEYFLGLGLELKKWYLAKTTLIGVTDPYTLKQRDLSHDITELPLLR